MARTLQPADYSAMVALISLLAIASVPATVLQTLSTKIVGELHALDQDRWVGSLAKRPLAVLAVIGLLVASIWGMAAGGVAGVLNTDAIWGVVIVGMLAGLGLVQPVLRGIVVGLRMFGLLATVIVVDAVGRLIFAILLVSLGLEASGAIGASLASAFLALAVLAAAVARWLRSTKPPEGVRPRLRTTGTYAQIKVAAISLGAVALLNLDVVLVKAFFSPETAAEFAAAALIGKTISFASSSVSLVVLPHAIRASVSGESTSGLLRTSLLLVALISLGAATVVLVFPELIYGVIFSSRYAVDEPLLWGYAIAGTMMGFAYLLANLMIGTGMLRRWYVLPLLSAAFGIAVALNHTNLRSVIVALDVTLLLASLFLAREAIFLDAQRLDLAAERPPA